MIIKKNNIEYNGYMKKCSDGKNNDKEICFNSGKQNIRIFKNENEEELRNGKPVKNIPEVKYNSFTTHIIFDFDCTLSYLHYFYTNFTIKPFNDFTTNQDKYNSMTDVQKKTYYNTQQVNFNKLKTEHITDLNNITKNDIDGIFKNTERLAILNTWLTKLQNIGCKLYISSRNNINFMEPLFTVMSNLDGEYKKFTNMWEYIHLTNSDMGSGYKKTIELSSPSVPIVYKFTDNKFQIVVNKADNKVNFILNVIHKDDKKNKCILIDDSNIEIEKTGICYIQPKPYESIIIGEYNHMDIPIKDIQKLTAFDKEYKEPIKKGENYLIKTFETVLSRVLSIDVEKIISSYTT